MLSLKWTKNKPKNVGGVSVVGSATGGSVFGFESVRYSMQTDMIGRVVHGKVCGGCNK
jgi:hypothetical protein